MLLVVLMCTGPMVPPERAAASEALQSLWVGDRIETFARRTVTGQTRLWTPAAPAIIIFWARWSRPSLAAVRDLVAAEPKSAARWEIMPINVDRAVVSSREATSIDAAVRQTGYKGPVWHDTEHACARRWGLLSVPTVIIVRMGGIVELAEVGWTKQQRDRIISTYCGAMTDTIPPPPPDSMWARCRRDLGHARFLRQTGKDDSAAAWAARAQSTCTAMAEASLLLSRWRWEDGDTSGALNAALAAVTADSTDPWSWVTLAAVEEHCERYGEAQRLAGRALALDSTFAPARLVLARCALETGDTLLVREMISVLEKNSRHEPELALVRARLRELRGDSKGAATDWREAIEGYLRTNYEGTPRRAVHR